MLAGERDGCIAIFSFSNKDDGGVCAKDEANQSTNVRVVFRNEDS